MSVFESLFLQFYVDEKLDQDSRNKVSQYIEHYHLKNSQVSNLSDIIVDNDDFIFSIYLKTFPNKYPKVLPKKNLIHILVCSQNENEMIKKSKTLATKDSDALLLNNFTLEQLHFLIKCKSESYVNSLKKKMLQRSIINLKNLQRKFNSFNLKTEKQAPLESMTKDKFQHFNKVLESFDFSNINKRSPQEIESVINQFFSDHFKKFHFKLLSWSHFSLDREYLDSQFFFFLPSSKDDVYGFILFAEDESPSMTVPKTFQCLLSLYYFFKDQHFLEDLQNVEKQWTLLLDSIPFPLALLKKDGELVYHNSLFSLLKIPPLNCLTFNHLEKVIIEDISYNVIRDEFSSDEGVIYLVSLLSENFLFQSSKQMTISSGEILGIVSSSLAHELNNPIGGVLAAIDVILMSDDESLEDDTFELLSEMKKGALRCKLLVETFLGFSRLSPFSPSGSKWQKLTENKSQIFLCFEQSQNLLRFRCVESGIRLEFKVKRFDTFVPEINLSVLTMIFYMIFGELMTFYSHQMLIDENFQDEKIIKGIVVEEKEKLMINVEGFEILSLNLSSFIKNLLLLDHLDVHITPNSIVLYNNKVMKRVSS